MASLRASCIAALGLITLAGTASADIVAGIYRDYATCDNHGRRTSTIELGDRTVFQPDAWIGHAATFTQQSACKGSDDPNKPNRLVVITNLTSTPFTDLFYVGDPRVEFSNVDGYGDQQKFEGIVGRAFRIDAVGDNRPLVFESGAPNGIFEPGETWHFIVQDYFDPKGLEPDSFFSIGYADGSVAVIEKSAASIVQFVPEPCPADCDKNGVLDIRDFFCFQGLYGAKDPAADCDKNGVLDIRDFFCFQRLYARGCD